MILLLLNSQLSASQKEETGSQEDETMCIPPLPGVPSVPRGAVLRCAFFCTYSTRHDAKYQVSDTCYDRA